MPAAEPEVAEEPVVTDELAVADSTEEESVVEESKEGLVEECAEVLDETVDEPELEPVLDAAPDEAELDPLDPDVDVALEDCLETA